MTAIAGRFDSDFPDNSGKMMKMDYSTGANLTPLNSSSSSTSSLCVGCGSAIYDPFILHVQPDLEWHGRCLNCSKCHRSLGNDPTCFVRDGKAYCREDYFNTFFYRCAGCHQIVSKSDLVFRIRSRAFHLDCFRCAVCDRLLQPGEEIAFQNEHVCCLSHAQLPQRPCVDMGTKSIWIPKLIVGSGSTEDSMERGPFKGKSGVGADAQQNPKIVNPGSLLPSLLSTRSDTTKASDPVEFDDLGSYDELCLATNTGDSNDRTMGNGTRTSGNILTELVTTEFPETFCSSPQLRPTSSGSSLGVALRDTDSPLSASSETSSLLGLSTSVGATVSEAGQCSTGPGSVSQGPMMSLGFGNSGNLGLNPQHNSGVTISTASGSNSSAAITNGHNGAMSNLTVGMDAGSQAGSGSSSSGTSALGCGDEVVHSIVVSRTASRPGKSGGSKRSKDHKTTRVRTVLNEKQLHTLRTCYAANPRPDALMKEQLVEMTSLSPRVIRVWFQNKRCKDKKRQLLLKQMEQHQQSGGRPGLLHGISMIASSPVRNDPNLMCPSSGIDIQQVPGAPYWKAAGELPSRPGSHCNSGSTPGNSLSTTSANGGLFRPNSPYNPMKAKLSRPATVTSTCAATSSPPTNVNPLSLTDPSMSYPCSVGSLLGPTQSMLSPFTGMTGGTLVHTATNTLNMLPPVDQGTGPTIPLNDSTNSGERGTRFGLLLPTPQPNMNMLQPNFVDEPSIPAFQQLMSNFDTTDTVQSLNVPTGGVLQPNSIYSSAHEFPKTSSTCPDNLLLSNVVSSQIPPNLSIPSRADFTIAGNSKLDSLLGGNGVGMMPPVSGFTSQGSISCTNGIALFGSTLNSNNHSPLRAPSPASFALNLLPNPSTGGFTGSGSYLHTSLSQTPIGAPTRAPLST